MRRQITLVTIFAAALLGFASVSVPAQAKVPGPNGQIVFGRFDASLGDFQIFTANPDGTSQVQLRPGVACEGSRHGTSPKIREAGPLTGSGSCSVARTERCSWSIQMAPGYGRSGSTQVPATTPPSSPRGRPPAPRSCSAYSSPQASNISTPSGRRVRTCGKWQTPKAATNSLTGDPTRWPARRARRTVQYAVIKGRR